MLVIRVDSGKFDSVCDDVRQPDGGSKFNVRFKVQRLIRALPRFGNSRNIETFNNLDSQGRRSERDGKRAKLTGEFAIENDAVSG
jgi:hypothetical protein